MKFQNSQKFLALLTIGSFLMAVISFSGLFLQHYDLTGRLITGFAWSIVTFGWISQFFYVKRNGQN